MIKVADNKIGTREFLSIILIAIGMKVTDATPGYLYNKAGNAAWLLPFFYIFTIGIPFLILLSLIKKHQKGLVDLIYYLTGKVLGPIICFILFLLIFSSMFINSKSYVSITNTLFYPKTSTVLLTFALLFTSLLIARRGLKAISSSAWLMVPILEITLIILLFVVWKEVNVLRLFPILGPGLGTVIKESINHSILVGEIILFAAFFPYVRSYKNYQFASLLGFGISLFKVLVFLAIYLMVFDYPSTLRMAYPHQELTRIAEFGTSMTHLEGAYFLFWLLSAIFRFAIYFYLLACLLGGALRFDKFEKLLIPLFGIIALSSLLPENTFTLGPFRDIILTAGSWILIGLPFFLWVLSKWKGGESNKKTANNIS